MGGKYLNILIHIFTYLKALSFTLFNVQVKIQLIITHKLVWLILFLSWVCVNIIWPHYYNKSDDVDMVFGQESHAPACSFDSVLR